MLIDTWYYTIHLHYIKYHKICSFKQIDTIPKTVCVYVCESSEDCCSENENDCDDGGGDDGDDDGGADGDGDDDDDDDGDDGDDDGRGDKWCYKMHQCYWGVAWNAFYLAVRHEGSKRAMVYLHIMVHLWAWAVDRSTLSTAKKNAGLIV